jgi:hypothetical protein
VGGVDDRAYERVAGWVLAFVGVLTVAVGVGWWFAAAPAPVPGAPSPGAQAEEPVLEPEQQADYDLLQQVGTQIPVLGDNVIYDVTMLGPGDWRSYDVPGSGASYEIQLVCRGGDEVLVALPAQDRPAQDELGVPCNGQVLIGEVGTGTVTVRRPGNASGAMAIRVSPVP